VEIALSSLPVALLYGALGLAAGLAYFRALAAGVRAFVGGAEKRRVLLLHALRIAGAVALFWAVATQGAVPLLAAFAGFLLARLIAGRREANALAAAQKEASP
jgi:hypothetical protein